MKKIDNDKEVFVKITSREVWESIQELHCKQDSLDKKLDLLRNDFEEFNKRISERINFIDRWAKGAMVVAGLVAGWLATHLLK